MALHRSDDLPEKASETVPYREGPKELFALRKRFQEAIEGTRKEVARISNIPTLLLLVSMGLGEYNWRNVDSEGKFLVHLWSLATIVYFQKIRRERERHLQSLLRHEGNLALHPDDTSAQEGFKQDIVLPESFLNKFVYSIQPIEAPTLLVSLPIGLQLIAQASRTEIDAVQWWHIVIGVFLAQLATRTQYEDIAAMFRKKMAGFARHITPPQTITFVRIEGSESPQAITEPDELSSRLIPEKAIK